MSIDKYQDLMNLIDNHQLNSKQELELLKEMKDYLINQKSSSRKVIKTICGQKYHISKKNVSRLTHICNLIQRKEYSLKNIDHNDWSDKIVHYKINNTELQSFNTLLQKLKDREYLINKSPILIEQYKELKYHIMDSYVDVSVKCQLISNFLKENTISFNFLAGKKAEKDIVEAVSDMKVEDLRGYEHHKKIDKEIKSTTKKHRTPKIFKRIMAGFSAFLMIGIASSIARSNAGGSVKKTEVSADTSTTAPTTKAPKLTKSKTSKAKKIIITRKTSSKTNIKKVMKSKITKPKKQNNIPKVYKPSIKKINSNNNKFKLGTKFQVKKDSLIYSNVNSANNKINGQKAYYNNDVVRTSVGLSMEYNKGIVTFIQVNNNQYKVLGLLNKTYLTEKEANKEITNLLKKGGKIKSLLSQNNNTYEGYYNKDEVKVLVKK